MVSICEMRLCVLMTLVFAADYGRAGKDVPVTHLEVVAGEPVYLPCDISTSDANDQVLLVLWYREDLGTPIYSVDGRDRDFSLAERWSDENVFANRAYFMPEKQPAELGVDHIRESDQAVYRCRVDFKKAQTRNSQVNLTVIGDKAILNFLRWGKFSLEKTKKRMDMYFTIRSAFPHLFTNRDISNPELKSNHDYFLFAVLPFMTDKARRITVVSAPRDDFQSEDLVNFGKIVFMISDIRLHLEEGALDTYIIDASIIQIKHFPKVPVSAIKDFLVSALEGYPVRVKEVHVVNASTVVSLVLKWASHFIKDKIIRRIQIHENLESLHKCIPKEYLPEEFGGTAGKLIDFSKQWILTLEERKQWFKEQEKLKADESKRVVVGTNRNNIFGVEGSFRQLMID